MVDLHVRIREPCAGRHHIGTLWTSRRSQTIPPRAVGAPGSPDPTTTSPGCRGVFPDPVQIPHAPKDMLVIPRLHTATPSVPRNSLTRRPENRLKRPYNLRQPMPPGSAPLRGGIRFRTGRDVSSQPQPERHPGRRAPLEPDFPAGPIPLPHSSKSAITSRSSRPFSSAVVCPSCPRSATRLIVLHGGHSLHQLVHAHVLNVAGN